MALDSLAREQWPKNGADFFALFRSQFSRNRSSCHHSKRGHTIFKPAFFLVHKKCVHGNRARRGGGWIAAVDCGVAVAHLDDALHESGRAEKKRADHHQYFPRLIQGWIDYQINAAQSRYTYLDSKLLLSVVCSFAELVKLVYGPFR